MADVDMYDYILTVPQPALIVQAPKPGPPPPQPKMSDREKEKKEEIEVRIWYAGLSREKQKEIRKRQFTYPPKCYCAKTVVVKCTCHEPKKEPAPKPEYVPRRCF